MALLQINLGNYANDGTGDDLRTAFTKVNDNFAALDTEFTILGGANVGTGTGVYAARDGVNLQFKTLTSTDNSVAFTNTATTVNLHANTRLANDLTPVLAANLNLAGHNIIGPGDTQTTVNGINVSNLSFLVSMIIESNTVRVDLGSIQLPSGNDTNFRGYSLDMGRLTDPTPQLQVNFGTIV
jgi:hypothetical protein